MKFGKTLGSYQVPEWNGYYLNYKQLKKIIKNILAKKATQEIRVDDIAPFLYCLDKQVDLVDSFFNKHYAEINRQFRIFEGYHDSGHAKENSDLAIDISALELQGQIKKLLWYAEINKRGFVKILKKFDKKLHTNSQALYLDSRILLLPFASSSPGSELASLQECLATLSKIIAVKSPEDLPKDKDIENLKALITTNNSDELEKELERLFILDIPSIPPAALGSLTITAVLTSSQKCLELLLKFMPGMNFALMHHRNVFHVIANSLASEIDTSYIICVKLLLNSLTSPEHYLAAAQDSYKRTPLHYAAQNGLTQLCETLLSYMERWSLLCRGSQLKPLTDLCWKDSSSLTPFHLAILSNHPDTVRILGDALITPEIFNDLNTSRLLFSCSTVKLLDVVLSFGFDVNYKDLQSEETILYVCSKLGQIHQVNYLLDLVGADSELAENTFGWTPLFAAATEGHLDVVEALIKAGADTSRVDYSGWTAREHACLRGYLSIAKALAKERFQDEVDSKIMFSYPFSPLQSSILGPQDFHESPSYISLDNLNLGPQLTVTEKAAMISTATSISTNGSSSVSSSVGSSVGSSISVRSSISGSSTRSSISSTSFSSDSKLLLDQLASRRDNTTITKTYGHKYLIDESKVVITLGSTDSRNPANAVELIEAPEFDTSLSLVISSGDNERSVLDLPLQDPNEDALVFSGDNSKKLRVSFDVVSTLSPAKSVLARAVALLDTEPSGKGKLLNTVSIPLLESQTLQMVGTVNFQFLLVKPFTHPNMSIENSYWKSLSTTRLIGHRGLGKNNKRTSLQLGENTIQSFIAASSLGASYVEFDVQLTKDHVPIIYHDFLVSETGLDVPVHSLTLEQFLNLKGDRDTGVKRRSSMSSSNKIQVEGEIQERMKLTRDIKNKGFKANSRGISIQAPYATLELAFKEIPERVGFNVECSKLHTLQLLDLC